LGASPLANAGFLKKPIGRIIAAIVVGVTVMILSGLIFQQYIYYACNGSCTTSENFLEELFTTISFISIYPPFVPILPASVLFARGSKEGAIAGFTLYLVPAAYLGIPSLFPSPDCHYCGLGAFASAGTLFLGTLVGAGGGVIGAWGARGRVK